MKTIHVPAKEQVSTASQAIFDQIQKKLGKVPNLYATIGYSAPALKGMLDYEATLTSSHIFTAKEREAINLIVSIINATIQKTSSLTSLLITNYSGNN